MLAPTLRLTLCLLVLAVALDQSTARPLKEDAKKALDGKKAELLQKAEAKLEKKKKPTVEKPAVSKPTVSKATEKKKPVKAPEKKPQQHHGHHKPHGGCGPKRHGKGGHRKKTWGKQTHSRSTHKHTGGCKKMVKGATKQEGNQKSVDDGHTDHENYGAIQHISHDEHF